MEQHHSEFVWHGWWQLPVCHKCSLTRLQGEWLRCYCSGVFGKSAQHGSEHTGAEFTATDREPSEKSYRHRGLGPRCLPAPSPVPT